MKAPRPTIRGFTLIELLVAMSIFVVLQAYWPTAATTTP